MDTDDITQGMSAAFNQMWEEVAQDAIILGMGVMILRSDMTLERIPPEKYHELTEALDKTQGNYINYKSLLKE